MAIKPSIWKKMELRKTAVALEIHAQTRQIPNPAAIQASSSPRMVKPANYIKDEWRSNPITDPWNPPYHKSLG